MSRQVVQLASVMNHGRSTRKTETELPPPPLSSVPNKSHWRISVSNPSSDLRTDRHAFRQPVDQHPDRHGPHRIVIFRQKVHQRQGNITGCSCRSRQTVALRFAPEQTETSAVQVSLESTQKCNGKTIDRIYLLTIAPLPPLKPFE